MLKVQALIKYLSENNPQSTPVRLALFNYLTNMASTQELVTPELLESFFALCLDYTHWQQNRDQLGSEIQEMLGEHVDVSALKLPQQTQVVELESLTDVTDALQCYLNAIYKKGEKYRLILEGDKKILAIVLMPDQSIQIRTFDRKMVIRHGQLEPLKKDLILYYNSNLEIVPDQVQRMEIGPFVTAQFILSDTGVEGSLIRGYQHQKFFDLKGENLATYPKLFYSIKRIEQYFLQRQSDPFYQETVSGLERIIEKMRLHEMDSFQEAVDIMARAQNVLEYVFTGDKLLTLLIRDLQHTLSQRNSRVARTPQKVEESWNPLTAHSSPPNSPNLNPQTRPVERPYPNPATNPNSLANRIKATLNPKSAQAQAQAQTMATRDLLSSMQAQTPSRRTMSSMPDPTTDPEMLHDLLGSDLTS